MTELRAKRQEIAAEINEAFRARAAAAGFEPVDTVNIPIEYPSSLPEQPPVTNAGGIDDWNA